MEHPSHAKFFYTFSELVSQRKCGPCMHNLGASPGETWDRSRESSGQEEARRVSRQETRGHGGGRKATLV